MEAEIDFERILTATADYKFGQSLQDWVSLILGDDIPVRNETTGEATQTRIENWSPDLLLLDLALPLSSDDPRRSISSTGLDFIEMPKVKRLLQKKATSVIVVDRFGGGTGVRRRIDRLGFVQNFPFSAIPQEEAVEELGNLMEGLTEARSAVPKAEPDNEMSERPILSVEVSLDERGVGNAIIHMTGYLYPSKPIFAAINETEYKSILFLSESLYPSSVDKTPSGIDWKEIAEHIGERIYDCLFGGELHDEIEYLREKSKLTDEDMRIRFNIPKGNHRVLFESLTTRQGAGFKSIDTPMARQLILNKKERRQGPRLREAACLNILVIDASKTGDRVLDTKESKDFKKWLRDVGSDISFPTLSHGQGEVEMFRDLERAEKENCPWRLPNLPDRELQATIGEIKIMNPDELGCKTPADFENEITKTLRDRAVDNGDWHIVHYIGHSVAAKAESGKSGFLMLPGGIRVTPVSVKKLLSALPQAGARFVYFSSCEFGSSEVALATAQRRVPATLGFRWKVGDKSALIFAQVFYHALFCERLTVDEAVRDARRETNIRAEGSDPTWVSAVFTCYGNKWHGGWGERLRRRGRAIQ